MQVPVEQLVFLPGWPTAKILAAGKNSRSQYAARERDRIALAEFDKLYPGRRTAIGMRVRIAVNLDPVPTGNQGSRMHEAAIRLKDEEIAALKAELASLR